MLKKEHRLNKTLDIEKVLKKGRSFFSPLFNLKYLPSKDLKFTVIVSNKVTKSAVKRNRIKRLCRDYWYKELPNIKPGYYILLIKPAILLDSSIDIKNELKTALIKAKILING